MDLADDLLVQEVGELRDVAGGEGFVGAADERHQFGFRAFVGSLRVVGAEGVFEAGEELSQGKTRIHVRPFRDEDAGKTSALREGAQPLAERAEYTTSLAPCVFRE